MERYIKHILNGVGGVTAMVMLWSCAAESPFESESTGTVQLHTVINNLTTRAEGQSSPADNCVVRIYRQNGKTDGNNKTNDGLIYKKNLNDVENLITLRTGHYLAEAQAGESSPASFDKKYFKGSYEFDVTANDIIQVPLVCKIQNTLVSINTNIMTGETGEEQPSGKELDDLMRDYTITVKSKTGTLTFTQEDITNNRTGYFMMADGDSELNYTIEGYRKNTTGTEGHFTKPGKITGVKHSWQYTINIVYNQPVSTDGHVDTSLINIEIADEAADTPGTESLENYNPTIKGIGFDISNALKYTSLDAIPDKLAVQVCATGNGFKAATLKIDDGEPQNLSGTLPDGIFWSAAQYNATQNVTTAYLEFAKNYIWDLSAGKHTFTISVTDNTISATDTDGKESTATLTINR